MLKFSQPTSADHPSLIIWLEYVVTTRQSFGLEIILNLTVRSAPGSHRQLHIHIDKQTHTDGGKGERL